MNRSTTKSARERVYHLALIVTASLFMSACGGGSGSTVLDKPGAALFSSSPSSITIGEGATIQHTIGGGGGGSKFTTYSASSSDARVATAAVEGTTIKIVGTGPGTTSITVFDTAGASILINVTVPISAVPKLSINAPDSLTLATGMTSSYQILGGAGPFSAVSSTPATATASIRDGSVIITATNPGAATIMVYDATGASGKITLTVGSGGAPIALYTTAPNPIGIPKNGATIEYAVNGGVAPYTATSGDLTVLSAQMDGNKLQVRGLSVGVAKVAIVDAVGTTITLNVGVIGEDVAATLLYTTAPETIFISAGAAPPYSVAGGTGPYTVSTSNPGVALATISSEKNLKITGLSAGVANIVVFDSTGATVRISVTVGGGTSVVPLYSTSPDAITVVSGAKPTFTIAGGAAPYVATSSNVKSATVAQEGNTFTVTGVAAGAAVVSIRDANGSAITIEVTVL